MCVCTTFMWALNAVLWGSVVFSVTLLIKTRWLQKKAEKLNAEMDELLTRILNAEMDELLTRILNAEMDELLTRMGKVTFPKEPFK